MYKKKRNNNNNTRLYLKGRHLKRNQYTKNVTQKLKLFQPISFFRLNGQFLGFFVLHNDTTLQTQTDLDLLLDAWIVFVYRDAFKRP